MATSNQKKLSAGSLKGGTPWKTPAGYSKISDKCYSNYNAERNEVQTEVGIAREDGSTSSCSTGLEGTSDTPYGLLSESCDRKCSLGSSETFEDDSNGGVSAQIQINSSDRFSTSLRNKNGSGSFPKSSPKGAFVPYLPQDDAVAAGLGFQDGGIDAIETQEVADLLNEELSKLLRLRFHEFWRAVTTDSSIQESLDSYLQFRRRWYELPVKEGSKVIAGVIVGDQELSRRVFMVLYRLSSNQDSVSSASNILSTKEHAETIREKRLLDIPKLLDICAIYGHDNPELTSQLVSNAFKAQSRFNDDLGEVVPRLLSTINTMYQRCCSTLVIKLSKSEAYGNMRLQEELLEVIDYLSDATTTLDAFLDAYPPGAFVLICAGSQSNLKEQLLSTLAAVHDTLLPALQKGLAHFSGSTKSESHKLVPENSFHLQAENHEEVESISQLRLQRLRLNLVKFAWHLLWICYLGEGYKKVQDRTVDYVSEKGFDTWAADGPVTGGDKLVHALLSMASTASGSVGTKGSLISNGALLKNIEKRYQLLKIVDKLRQNGSIALDDIQYECICSLFLDNISNATQLPDISTLFVADQSEGQEEIIMYQSKISHIKDIFPDYGNGFLAACLEVYDNNTEEVIQRILEGTLHPDLLSVDTSLEIKPNILTANQSGGKGKGKKVDTADTSSGNTRNTQKGIHGNAVPFSATKSEADGLKQRLASSSSAGSSKEDESSGLEKPVGRFVRKDKGEGNMALLLDQRDTENILRAAALAVQYEDEYDDSFDDLGTNIADGGVEETDGFVDRMASRPSGGAERRGKTFLEPYSDRSLRRPVNRVDDDRGWRGDLPTSRRKPYQETLPMKQAPEPLSSPSNLPAPSKTVGPRGRGRRWQEPKGQFYVKDGKNYSYKTAGAVGVASVEEAEALKKKDEDTIYGLGQGGNVQVNAPEAIGRNSGGSGDRNARFAQVTAQRDAGGRGGTPGRGRGGPRKDHDRKDRAMKKHFSGLGGF